MQIFAVALYFHKFMCSSGTLKWKYYKSPFCCSHSQMTRKSVKTLNLRHPGSPSQQHSSPCSQSMPFAGAALFKQGEAKIKGSLLTDTSHSCHPQPDHSLQMLLLITKELPCSLYPTTLWFSVGGYPEKIWWTNPYRKPKSKPRAISFTLRCKGLKQWFISTSTEKYLLRKESSGAKGSLQLQLAFAHDVSAGTICHSSFWWIVYSWVLSS